MPATIDYFFSLISPWSYLGSERFHAIVRRHGAQVVYKPVHLPTLYAATGGVPLAKRAPARQAYRLQELERWRQFLGMPLNLHPKFFPADDTLAARMVVAADRKGLAVGALTTGILRAVWAEERDIADRDTLVEIAAACGCDGERLLRAAARDEVAQEYARHTDEAIRRGVFGVPTYALGGQLFWGQDRLDFLDRALSQATAGPRVAGCRA